MLKDLPLQSEDDILCFHCITQFKIPEEEMKTSHFYPGFPLSITCYWKCRAMAETINFRYLIPEATL